MIVTISARPSVSGVLHGTSSFDEFRPPSRFGHEAFVLIFATPKQHSTGHHYVIDKENSLTNKL
jgi:hypothetical protein